MPLRSTSRLGPTKPFIRTTIKFYRPAALIYFGHLLCRFSWLAEPSDRLAALSSPIVLEGKQIAIAQLIWLQITHVLNHCRKGSYLVCVIFFIIGSVAFLFCRALSSIELLIFGRICVGLASGITTTCLPMYLSEIAPLQLRGTLGVFCSMGITGGVVVGQIVSLQETLGTEELWHYCLSFQLLFLIICTLPYRMFPESPKYLYSIASDRQGAMRELKKLCDSQEMVLEELDTMEPTSDTIEEKQGILDVLSDPKLLLPLVLVCCMQGGQQLSGINAVRDLINLKLIAIVHFWHIQVFYYSVLIFESIGFSSTNAKWANLAAGCLNLTVSFFSPVLMEKINRRPLMISSCCGCAVFLTMLSICYGFAVSTFSEFQMIFNMKSNLLPQDKSSEILPIMCVVALLGYILVYQIGLGPIPFFCGSGKNQHWIRDVIKLELHPFHFIRTFWSRSSPSCDVHG